MVAHSSVFVSLRRDRRAPGSAVGDLNDLWPAGPKTVDSTLAVDALQDLFPSERDLNALDIAGLADELFECEPVEEELLEEVLSAVKTDDAFSYVSDFQRAAAEFQRFAEQFHAFASERRRRELV